MVAVVVFEFGVMRCQPLRRALCAYHKKSAISAKFKRIEIEQGNSKRLHYCSTSRTNSGYQRARKSYSFDEIRGWLSDF